MDFPDADHGVIDKGSRCRGKTADGRLAWKKDIQACDAVLDENFVPTSATDVLIRKAGMAR